MQEREREVERERLRKRYIRFEGGGVWRCNSVVELLGMIQQTKKGIFSFFPTVKSHVLEKTPQ